MASTTQQNYPHARQQYPAYSGFFGYILPFHDGVQSKILRGDGTLYVGQAREQDTPCGSYPWYSACDCKPGPYNIQNFQQPPAYIRWCPSDSNTAPCNVGF